MVIVYTKFDASVFLVSILKNNTHINKIDKTNIFIFKNKIVTPQTRGSVDYPSTYGIPVDVGLPDATSENRAESPLYGELYPDTSLAYTISQTVQHIQYISNMATWAHKQYSIYKPILSPTIYPIVTREVINSPLYNTY